MERSSFLRMWMDVWNGTEQKGLKMPEEMGIFQKRETKRGEVLKKIIQFLPEKAKRDFLLAVTGKTMELPESAVSQRNRMTVLEKGQKEKESISFLEERKRKGAANMKAIGKKIQENGQEKPGEVFWSVQSERNAKMPMKIAETEVQKKGENLFSPVFAADGTDTEILRLLRQWQKKEYTPEAGQQVSISIGQVRESADVDRVMEALTAKLREAHLSGVRKARGG